MRTIRYIHVSLIALVLPLMMAQITQPTALPVGSATVMEIKGKVSLRSPQGTELPAQRGVVLAPETTIDVAKGSVLLDVAADGSQVLIKGKSQVVLKEPSQNNGSSLQLLIGDIVAKIKKRLGETPPFRMGTPTAVITVRGTHFSVEVTKKQKTIVEVFDGLVEVDGLGPAPGPVMIRPGFSTRVPPNRRPEAPRRINEFEGPRSEQENQRGPGIGEPGENPRQGTQPQPSETPREQEHPD